MSGVERGGSVVSETIPESLRPQVDAALAWFNGEQGDSFEVTGILDPDASLAESDPRSLRLVLCGGDRCEQRSFRVGSADQGFDVTFLEDAPPSEGQTQAELDPPPGARREWLDRALAQHEFVVLAFYRGFW